MNEKIILPKIIQYEAYRIEKCCECPDHQAEHFYSPATFTVDGYAETNIGMMLCCTCNECGYKFRFHLRCEGNRYYPKGDLFNDSNARITLQSLKQRGAIK